jgi:hypothetical protein
LQTVQVVEGNAPEQDDAVKNVIGCFVEDVEDADGHLFKVVGRLEELVREISEPGRHRLEELGGEQGTADLVLSDLPEEGGYLDAVEEERPEEEVLRWIDDFCAAECGEVVFDVQARAVLVG